MVLYIWLTGQLVAETEGWLERWHWNTMQVGASLPEAWEWYDCSTSRIALHITSKAMCVWMMFDDYTLGNDKENKNKKRKRLASFSTSKNQILK